MDDFQGDKASGNWRLFIMDDTPDGAGQLSLGWSLTIHATDYPVRANNDSYSVDENDKLRVSAKDGVLDNDPDRDDDVTRLTVRNKPNKGRLSLRQNGSFVYRPDRNKTGTDSFVYEVTDGGGTTDSAKVTIRINEERDRDRD